MNTSPKRFITLYVLFNFFFTLLFWTPIFFEFQKRIGIAEPEIFRIQSLYYLLFCILEIPTGFFADRFGKRQSMVVGSWILVLCHLVALTSMSYWGQLAHFAGVALARSLISGAATAYLYNYLEANGAKSEFKKREGQARAYTLLGRVFCFAVTGPLFEYDIRIPYLLTLLSALVAVGLAYVLPRFEEAKILRNIDLMKGFKTVLSHPKLMFVIGQGVGLFVLSRIVAVNLFQPLLKESGFQVASFGLIMGVFSLFESFGSAFPQHLRRYLNDLNSVYVMTLGMALILIAMPWANKLTTFWLFGLFFLICGYSYPIQRQLMNDVIPDSQYRATLLSIESIVDRGVSAAVAFALEKISLNQMGTSTAHTFVWGAGVVTLGYIALLIPISRRIFKNEHS